MLAIITASIALSMLTSVASILRVATKEPPKLDYTASLYAAAAYCTKSSLTEWSCGAMCGEETTGTTLLTHFHHPHTDTTGFIAINHGLKVVVLSFRGSLSLLNWVGNLNTFPQKTPWKGTDALVHSGFLSGYLSVREVIRDHVGYLSRHYPTYDHLLTGHSLGGALATLAAVDISKLPIQGHIKLITFGSPRVGDSKWTEYVASCGLNVTRRWVNKADLVPHLPPRALGFRHSPQEWWVDLSGGVVACSAVDGEDGRCSRSLLVANSLVDHLSIFGHLFGPLC